jgi:hypothetical protein
MKIRIVSTFSDNGFEEYGKNFVEGCKRLIGKDIEVVLYIDNASIKPTENVKIVNLEKTIPQIAEFKKRNSHRTGFKDFRWDGVRFCYKSYVMCHAAKDPGVDILIWLDADTGFQAGITPQYLSSFLPNDKFVGYLGRKGAPETGFLIFNLRHPIASQFFSKYEWYYNSDELYKLEQYHDAWIFQELRNEFEEKGSTDFTSITVAGELKNPFDATFKNYMVHYKGSRKEQVSK